jgi:heptosyltransferase-2
VKIVIWQTAFLGDLLLTLPLIDACRASFPEGKLTLAARADLAPLVEADDRLAAVIRDDKWGSDRGLPGIMRMAGRLRAAKFDVALSPHRSHRTAMILAAARIPERIGYDTASFGFLYTRRIPFRRELHEAARMTLLAGEEHPALPRLLPDSLWIARAEKVLRGLGLGEGERFVALAPGSIWPTKRWTQEGFRALSGLLAGKGIRTVVVGNASERSLADPVAEARGAVCAAGLTDLPTLAGLLSRASAVVANDSGVGHLAAAVGAPVVSIFGPTVPAQGFAPLARVARVVGNDALSCRPCSAHGTARCPEGHFRCMKELPPVQVFDAVSEVLRGEG